MSITLDGGIATLIAASVAFIAAVVSIKAANASANLHSKQSIVSDDLKLLSNYIYQVVALSAKAARSKDDKQFSSWIEKATKVATKLDELRRDHRYSLPFIEEPIWYLKGTPLDLPPKAPSFITRVCGFGFHIP